MRGQTEKLLDLSTLDQRNHTLRPRITRGIGRLSMMYSLTTPFREIICNHTIQCLKNCRIGCNDNNNNRKNLKKIQVCNTTPPLKKIALKI